MIKANELRLGNYIYSPVSIGYSPQGFIKVTSISEKGINHWRDMGASGVGEFDKIDGIPITHELLVKVGFLTIPKDSYTLYQLDDFKIELHEKFYFIVENFLPPIDYLHQMQNLYFHLSGKELEINL